MSNRIRHTGVVDSVAKGKVVVRIMQSSACASCEAARLCRSSESKEKLITVATSRAWSFSRGQAVSVEGSLRMGLKAVGLAYAIPTVLLTVAVMTAVALGVSEPVAAMIAIAALVPYGLLLWLLRGKLGRRFRFEIATVIDNN